MDLAPAVVTDPQLPALDRLVAELVRLKFGGAVASRRTDVAEFVNRWRFVFSLPSMRKLLPYIVIDPLIRLKRLEISNQFTKKHFHPRFFPSPDAIKKFISADLAALLSPPGIKKPSQPAQETDAPYKFETPQPDLNLFPAINLAE